MSGKTSIVSSASVAQLSVLPSRLCCPLCRRSKAVVGTIVFSGEPGAEHHSALSENRAPFTHSLCCKPIIVILSDIFITA